MGKFISNKIHLLALTMTVLAMQPSAAEEIPITEDGQLAPAQETTQQSANRWESRSTRAADLLSQDSGQPNPVEVTGIKVNTEMGTIDIILETNRGSTLNPVTRTEGNTLIAEIPNTVLRLPNGQAFEEENPTAGIARISIAQSTPDKIQIRVVGQNALPSQEVKLSLGSFSYSLNPIGESKLEIVVTQEEEQLDNPVPQVGVTREEFSLRNSLRLGDIIERMPGTLVDGPPGENNDVRLRGIDKEFTRITIDGLTFPDGGEKREFQVRRLPSFLIEDVAVIRNPTAEFESDGIAGRVNVQTRSLPTDFFLEGRVGFGGQDTINGEAWNVEAAVGDRPFRNFAYLAGISILNRPIEVDRFKLFSTGNLETETETRDQRFTDGSVTLGFPYEQGTVAIRPIWLNFDESKEKLRLVTAPGRAATQEEENDSENRRTIGVSLSHNHTFGSRISISTVAGIHQATEDKDKNRQSFTANNQGIFQLNRTTLEEEEKSDSTYNLNTTVTIPFEAGLRQEVRVGGSLRIRDRFRDKERREIDNRGRERETTEAKDNYEISESYFAGFIQDQIWLSDRFSILPGVRVEHVSLNSSDSTGREGERSVTDINPSLHLLYRVTDDLSLRAAISRGVNRPKFDELSPFEDEKNDRIIIGNPDLEPARSLNLDVGGEYATRYAYLGVNFFYRNVTGVIEEVNTGQRRNSKDIFQVQNVGDGWIGGFELEQRLNLGFTRIEALKGFSIWANQALLDSELTDSRGRTRPFKEQPSFVSNLGLDYTYQPWGTTLSISWNYVSERRDFNPNGNIKTIEPLSFVTLAVRQAITSNLSLFFEASNLTNAKKTEREALANGGSTRRSEDAGQSFLLGINWKF